MAATLQQKLGLESELVRGSGGVFVVSVANDVIFSKKQEGRFPTEQEIVEKLEARRSSP